MANKSTKKSKKPLQTTLGRASSSSGEKVDLSHVRQPIHTNICGLSQVISLLQTGTPEVNIKLQIHKQFEKLIILDSELH